MADKQHRAWRSGNCYALPTSPHPRRRLLEIRNSCVTLTHPTAQKIGHSTHLTNVRLSIRRTCAASSAFRKCLLFMEGNSDLGLTSAVGLCEARLDSSADGTPE